MQRVILYLSTPNPLSIFFLSFSIARLNWVYDVIICIVRLTQILATADHNMKMFLEIAIFLQNQFIQKLICDLLSQPIFKLSATN